MHAKELQQVIKTLMFESGDDGRQIAVPYIIGEKGDGKSTIVKDISEENKAYVIDVRLALEDVPDLKGFPYIEEITKDGKTVSVTNFATPHWIPQGAELEKLKEEYDYIVIFLDEMARAKLSVHQVIFKWVLDFAHDQIEFDPCIRFIAADNPATKDYKGVNKLDDALKNRFCVLSYDGPDLREWLDYEEGHSNPMFLRFMTEQDRLYRQGQASPRTLSKIGRRVMNSTALDDPGILFNITDGMVGSDFAAALCKYVESSYQAIKAAELFESGTRDFKKHINTLSDWNSSEGKMTDAISETVSSILDYFADPLSFINWDTGRFISICNCLPEDKVWGLIREFINDRDDNYKPAYRKVQSEIVQNSDCRAILKRLNSKIGNM